MPGEFAFAADAISPTDRCSGNMRAVAAPAGTSRPMPMILRVAGRW